MLEHAAGNKNGAKRYFSRAAGFPPVANKASPKRGWLFVVSRFRLRVRVLLDLGLGGGETGVKINHLRSRCKHTVNNALKTAVCWCYQYLWFLCLSITKVVNLREEYKMGMSFFQEVKM